MRPHFQTLLTFDFSQLIVSPLFTANREKFQEAAAVRPESFSSVQLQTYLKASAFRQKIEGFKRKIGGAGDDGGARRLASDERREFVFRKDGQPARRGGGGGGGGRGWGQGGGGGEKRRGLGAHNAAALAAAPPPAAARMAPLSTKIALAAFKGAYKDGAGDVDEDGGAAAASVRGGSAGVGGGGGRSFFPLPSASRLSGALGATPSVSTVSLAANTGVNLNLFDETLE